MGPIVRHLARGSLCRAAFTGKCKSISSVAAATSPGAAAPAGFPGSAEPDAARIPRAITAGAAWSRRSRLRWPSWCPLPGCCASIRAQAPWWCSIARSGSLISFCIAGLWIMLASALDHAVLRCRDGFLRLGLPAEHRVGMGQFHDAQAPRPARQGGTGWQRSHRGRDQEQSGQLDPARSVAARRLVGRRHRAAVLLLRPGDRVVLRDLARGSAPRGLFALHLFHFRADHPARRRVHPPLLVPLRLRLPGLAAQLPHTRDACTCATTPAARTAATSAAIA